MAPLPLSEMSSHTSTDGTPRPMTVVIGENLIDLLVGGDGVTTAVPGGGPFNVARTIGRLGQPITFLSGLSHDAFGVILRSALEHDHVQLSFRESLDQPTTLAVVNTSAPTPSYSFHLRDTAAFEITRSEGLNAFRSIPSPSALYVGTLGLVVEPMATTVEDIVADAHPSTLVILDPNCRPSATSDYDAYRSRITRLLHRSDIVKVSTEDLEFLFPKMAHDDAAAALMQGGAAVVIVTDGANAVQAYSDAGVSEIAVPISNVEDTVGAGDALVGGLLAYWSARQRTREDAHSLPLVAEALGVAVKISSFTCSRKGAEPPWSFELESSDGAWFK
jgi:fructokinase